MDDKKKKEEKVEVKMIEYFFAISMQNSKPISQILVINSQSDITASVNWNYIVCWQTLVDQSGNLLNEVGIWWRVVYHKQRVEAEKGKLRGRRHPLLQCNHNYFCLVSKERERDAKAEKWKLFKLCGGVYKVTWTWYALSREICNYWIVSYLTQSSHIFDPTMSLN